MSILRRLKLIKILLCSLVTIGIILSVTLAFGAAATMYITVAGAGDKSGSSWANAMGLEEFTTDMTTNAEAGDIYWLYSGTYTLTARWLTSLDGSSTAMIKLMGCSDQETPPTEATSATRPLIACGTDYDIVLDNYWELRNVVLTGTFSQLTQTGEGSLQINCKGTNTSETGNRSALWSDGNGKFISCEATSTNGYGIRGGSDGSIHGCYAHNSSSAIYATSTVTVTNCIIDTSINGIYLGGAVECKLINNTIYDCTTGIGKTTGHTNTFLNNTISSCTTGASASGTYTADWWDYNNWYDNTADTNNVTKGANATAVDPTYTDAPNGDFTIGTNMKAAGFPGEFPGGLTTGYMDTGAAQREEAGGEAVTGGIGLM